MSVLTNSFIGHIALIVNVIFGIFSLEESKLKIKCAIINSSEVHLLCEVSSKFAMMITIGGNDFVIITFCQYINCYC